MKDYPIDIAISLCHEDMDYAKKIHKALNPKLNVFLYSERQAELLTTSGLLEFAKKFRDEARLVVILYRDRWGKGGMTEIEQEAIWERTKKKEEGHDFIVMVPLEGREVPVWYPKSRIYADPGLHSVEEVARLIEYQFAQREGVVEPLTLEDKIAYFKEKEKQRIEHIKFLESKESGPMAIAELKAFVKKVNEQIDILQHSELNYPKEIKTFNEASTHSGITESATMALENHRIEFQIRHTNVLNFKDTAQAFTVVINHSHASGAYNQGEWQKMGSKLYRVNTDGQHLKGWSEVLEPRHKQNDKRIRFYYRAEDTYDLGPIIPTAELVENQFIWLFEQMENRNKNLLKL